MGDRVFIIKKSWVINRLNNKFNFLLIRIPYCIKIIKGYLYKLKLLVL